MSKLEKKLAKLPDTPGVYFFLGKGKKILYIGKATSLRSRVRSYFAPDLVTARSPLIAKMVESAENIEFRETLSVLEALLLEADLIKKFKPAFNTKEKDDKSFNCIVITKEDFPVLRVIRKKELDNPESLPFKIKKVFGPFSNGGELREALKIMRRILPYRDEKCPLPEEVAKKKPSPCFNYTIGLCPGVCAGAISKKEYAKRIKDIEEFLSGNFSSVVKSFEKEMAVAAENQEFEKAKMYRDRLFALRHINDVALIKPASSSQDFGDKGFRIESYDIAHMAGKDIVGVMTVVLNGEAQKSEYRKFNIKTLKNQNDPAALKEVLTRRLEHNEWRLPDLIVVDGGSVQLEAMYSVLLEKGLGIPVVSVVKDKRHKAKGILGKTDLGKKHKNSIILANSEAHRFALAFHQKKRGKNFLV